ncbi:hypothetical protein ACHAQH_000207 [Verticillium albo-atrum]
MLTNIALALAVLPLINAANFTKSALVYHRQDEECGTASASKEDADWYKDRESSFSGEEYFERYFGDKDTRLSNWKMDEPVSDHVRVILPDGNIPAVQHTCIGIAYGFFPENHRENKHFCTMRRPFHHSPQKNAKDVEEYAKGSILADIEVHHSVNPTDIEQHTEKMNGKTREETPEQHAKWAECKPKGSRVKKASSVPGRVLAGQVLESFGDTIRNKYEKPQLTFSIGPFNAITSFFSLARLDTSSPESEMILQEATSVAFELV